MRTKADWEELLKNQRSALRDSAIAYDSGKRWEAMRLATTIHILVHDYKRTTSLLTHLQLKSGLRFISTAARYNPANLAPHWGLCFTEIKTAESQTEACFVPFCVAVQTPLFPVRSMQFRTWWDEIIFKMPQGKPLSRKNLVFSLRDQDGGAHIDKELSDESYGQFRSLTIGIGNIGDDVDSKPRLMPPNAHLASMRQIAWEIEETLKAIDKDTL